ncbi:hypothetical protein CRENBAI_025921 [Crenichthys baileyi]|uniref:Uncharacterized protein n=1 Tax=Crenichthys baileyi TaxID=28760 RepID=A0AAV9S6X2_9TELE
MKAGSPPHLLQFQCRAPSSNISALHPPDSTLLLLLGSSAGGWRLVAPKTLTMHGLGSWLIAEDLPAPRRPYPRMTRG